MLPSSCGVWDVKERSKNLCLKLSSNIILIKMRTPTVAVPSGNSFFFFATCFCCCFLLRRFGYEASGVVAAISVTSSCRDPFRSLAIRAPQLETTLMFHSNQLSSVTFSGGVSLRLRLFLGLHKTARATRERDGGGECQSLTSQRRHPQTRRSQVALVISGAISCRWDPFPQSALTYEATTLSHPVSHMPRFHTWWWQRRRRRRVGANHS